MKKDNKEQNMKKKRHFDPARGAVRIIALLLVVIMLLATCGTLVYYLLINCEKGEKINVWRTY